MQGRNIARENQVCIGVLTSGGDAPGMNSAIKSIIKSTLNKKAMAYGIYDGFEGLINNRIRKLEFADSVFDNLEGGTILRTARCDEFMRRDGRKKAIYSLLRHGINCLIIIGGGGSLNGGLILKNEFKELLDEIVSDGLIRREERNEEELVLVFRDGREVNYYDELKVVGIPGTIDNDIYGTEKTLGADTAGNRVMEVCDRLLSTMRSHGRIFVLECMGNGCGWITLFTAFALNGDYIILPERPKANWKKEMVETIEISYRNKKDGIMIFLCEKSTDEEGKAITLEDVVDALGGYQVRGYRVGHTQRGGPTSAIDSFLGILGGIKSVEYCFSKEKEAKMVSYWQHKVKLVRLDEIIEIIRLEKEMVIDKKICEVFERRSDEFKEMYRRFEEHRAGKIEWERKRIIRKKKILLLNDGNKICGMDGVINMIAQEGIYNGYEIFESMNGFDGLSSIEKAELYEFTMGKNINEGMLGSSEKKEIRIKKIEDLIAKAGIDYLVMFGGNSSIRVAKMIRNTIIIPVSYENNVNGTGASIGCDTALNNFVTAIRGYKRNIASYQEVSIVEYGEANSEYVKIVGGIGSDVFEILSKDNRNYNLLKENKKDFEVINNFKEIEKIKDLKKKIIEFNKKRKDDIIIILKSKNTYKYSMIEQIFLPKIKSNQISNVFGITGQGIYPSFRDRILANLMGLELINAVKKEKGSGMIVVGQCSVKFKPIEEITENKYENQEWLKNYGILDFIEKK